MSSTINQLTNILNEAEASAHVMKAKAEALITFCRKARKNLAAKGVSTSLKSQSPVVHMVVADAVTKRAKKYVK